MIPNPGNTTPFDMNVKAHHLHSLPQPGIQVCWFEKDTGDLHMKFCADENEAKRISVVQLERGNLLRVFACITMLDVTPGKAMRINDDLKAAVSGLLTVQSAGKSLTVAPRGPASVTPSEAMDQVAKVAP